MPESAIRVEGLSKKFMIGSSPVGRGSYQSFREVLTEGVKSLVNRKTKSNGPTEEFWALRDVTFNIEKGERVGIIGRNGAGKSTLLKILSQITEPTTGAVRIKGRVASLLEVGTGFHPELTGRENIYLNGAILGMTRQEVKRKFDEMVAFAEVEKFLDTPVKRYSSGMYVRLAFAVAAHLEPEILVVDEVLAVGDAQFQKKCLGKMEDVSRGEGRTVLFVSHNMQAVSTLCNYGIFMNKGMADAKTSVRDAIAQYSLQQPDVDPNLYPLTRKDVTIHSFAVTQNGIDLSEFEGQRPIDVTIDFEVHNNLSSFRIGFFIKSAFGDMVNRSLLADWDDRFSTMPKGRYRITGVIPANYLAAGNYSVQVHSSRFGLVDYGTDEPTSTRIAILAPDDYNQAYIGEHPYGIVLIKQNWQVTHV